MRLRDTAFLSDYTDRFPACEVSRYFRSAYGRVVYPDERGRETEALQFGGRMPMGHHIHHICGSGNGAARDDVLTNVIHVCATAHAWLEQYKIAGQVLCCFVKRDKGELDWAELTRIKGKRMPGWFETDQVAECCRHWTFIEAMRRSLTDAD